MSSSILSFFPKHLTPRPVQVGALEKIEEAWSRFDVLVVNLPVASGKSSVALTVARWAHKIHQKGSRIITPTNILVDQYLEDFPALNTLKASRFYPCTPMSHDEYRPSCKDTKGEEDRYCSTCPYLKAMKKAMVMPYGVYNTYTYMAHKLHKKRPLLIADEAHNLLGNIREFAAKQLWQKEYHFPSWVRTYGTLKRWIEEALEKKGSWTEQQRQKLGILLVEITNNKVRYLVHRTTDLYRGREEDVIKLLPVDVRDQPPILWPTQEKILLLSATIGRKDIEQMGLDKRRVLFIAGQSPIPADRRPLIIGPQLHGLSINEQDSSIPAVAETIKYLLEKHPEKGFIHATYSLAEKLKAHLGGEGRLMWHDRSDKMKKYQEFRDSPTSSGAVLVASGLYEGVDLPEDLGRWQCIVKLPWPSLGEPAIHYMAEVDPEWYANETVKMVCQAYGRVCRGPTDFGVTYLIDRSFLRLYDNWEELFPGWFKEAVTFSRGIEC